MGQRNEEGAAPRAFAQSSPESSYAAGAPRPREGVGSSSGRVAAAMKMARGLRDVAASPAPLESETAAQTLARSEQIYRARRERELLFERQAQRLEALLHGPAAL